MQIKTLYLNLKDSSGKLNQDRRLDIKVTESLYKYGRMPKWTPKGYYRTILTPDAELQSSIDALADTVEYRLNKLLKSAPHIVSELTKEIPPHYTHDAYDFKKQRCILLCSITNLLRAKAQRNWSGMEVAFYHINTAWLEINRVVHGSTVTYKNADTIAHKQGTFIPMKERWYGKRKR